MSETSFITAGMITTMYRIVSVVLFCMSLLLTKEGTQFSHYYVPEWLSPVVQFCGTEHVHYKQYRQLLIGKKKGNTELVTIPRLPNRGTTKPMFKCPYPTCGKKYHRSDRLKKHELLQHQNLETPFRCSTCQRNFLTANDLKNHESDVHTGSKLCCTRCGKSFRNESDLQVYISADFNFSFRKIIWR